MSDQPKIHVDVFGNSAPKAARFGEGVSDIAGVRQATNARDNLSTRQSTMKESIDSNLQYKPTAK